MLIAARESFAAARKRLPYDAEVEYLQSSGTQYIDTGVGGGSDTDFELNVMMPSPTGRQIAGARFTSSNFRYVQIQSNPSGNILFAYNNTQTQNAGAYKTLSGWMTLRATGSSCYVDDVLLYRFAAAQFASAGTIWLHATRGASAQGTAALRISTARIWSGGALVRDYIPVRVGTTGEMYDRIGGTFATRVGTLTVGPDKTA